MKRLLFACLLIAVAFAADAGNYTCQIDQSALFATGRTRTDPVTGTLLWEYKCPMGHTYWIAPTSPNAGSAGAAQQPQQQQPDYSYLHDAGKQAAELAGRHLGQMLGTALQSKQVVGVMVVVKCGHYDVADITYRDGSIKVMDMPDKTELVDREQLKTLAARTSGFSWGEIECDDPAPPPNETPAIVQDGVRPDSAAHSGSVQYRGTYECAQGTTGLSLSFDATSNSPSTYVVFTFGPTPSNSNVPSGSFIMTGRIDMAAGVLDLRPVSWVARPPGYRMVGLSGTSIDGGRTFSGNVVTDIACSRFSVTRN